MMTVNQAEGLPFPGRPDYLTGRCGHAVAGSEWKAGYRTCERCPVIEGQLTIDEALDLMEDEP